MEGPDNSSVQAQWMRRQVCEENGLVLGGGGCTRGVATDISWRLLDDVSAHQRTTTAIVGPIGKQETETTSHSCVLQDYFVANVPLSVKCFIMRFVVSLEDGQPTLNSIINCTCVCVLSFELLYKQL